MSVKVANSRLIVPSLKRYAGFYQQLLQSVSGFQDVGNRLVHLAENGRALRQTAQVEESGLILSNIPLREYQLVGQYYLGVCDYRRGELEKTQRIFEQVVEAPFLPTYYRSRAMLSLAAIAADNGDYATELYFGLESLKASSDFSIRLEALKGIAVIKAKEGDHRYALKDLENLIPIIKYADPLVYCDVLNSYAVELVEVGRVEQAQNVCRITLASPFAFAYPEWRETWQDSALRGYKSRSSVPVIQSFLVPKKTQNVLRLPERERSEVTKRSPFFQPSEVTSLEDWKNKMVKEPNGDDIQLPEDMSPQDMAMKILELITENKDDEEKIRKLMESAIKIFSGKK
jgi:hypothetical protein